MVAYFQPVRLRVTAFALALWLVPALFTGTGRAAARGQQGAEPGTRQPGVRRGAPQANKPGARQQSFLQHLRGLPPDQQETILRSNPTFQSMPPWRQQQIRDMLRPRSPSSRLPGGPPLQNAEHSHQPGFFQQLRGMPPAQQEKILQNDAQFQSLPAERQAQVRANLRRWNGATPDERQILVQREEIVQSLSPEQRDQLRQVFPRWRELPAADRQAVMDGFRKLRDLPPAERDKYLASPEVERLSPEDRDILGNLKGLLPAN